MSDLRYDPVFDSWVAVAESRRDRPIEFVPVEQTFKQLICPFCCGNEEETPPELMRMNADGQLMDPSDQTDWQTRVIPNKYPTYFAGTEVSPVSVAPYSRAHDCGDQELIIPTPRHVYSFSDLTVDEFVVGLQAAQQRMRSKAGQNVVAHSMLFGNCRYEAGASVAHVHFQLIGSPLVSPALKRREKRFAAHRQQSGRSLLQDLLQFELATPVRVVAETERLVMLCPFASRHAFQVWIVPRQADAGFVEESRELLKELVELSQQYLRRVEVLLSEPAYNWMLHQLPPGTSESSEWFVEVLPRIAKCAGYEMGTDIWINPVAPEVAARRLK